MATTSRNFQWLLNATSPFFNAEGIWGAVIHGIVIAMEEQRALGLPISTEAISGVKVGMMGPLSGIGDTIDWSTLRPLLIALVLPLAENGSFLAPIIYGILLGGITFAENMFFVKTGYRMGTQAALSVLEGGAINKFISCASVLGMFMMGGLSASMVNVYTTVQIPTSGCLRRLSPSKKLRISPLKYRKKALLKRAFFYICILFCYI